MPATASIRSRRLRTAAVAIALLATPWRSGGQDERPTDRQVLMDRKLEHAGRVLGGLATNRLDAVAASARELRKVSEEAARYSLPTADYRRYSDEFRRLSDALAEEAEAGDLDGAALVNVRLTINCVECHKYVRIQARDDR